MGSKANPGKYNCYEKAKQDEPMFVLLARDELAPLIVRLWVAVSSGNVAAARDLSNQLRDEARLRSDWTIDANKLLEANILAGDMAVWKATNPRI